MKYMYQLRNSTQAAIILCEMFESRANFLNEKFKFNSQQCNSTSSFSGGVHRDKSIVVIALPKETKTVQLFEKIHWLEDLVE